ncbi:hypothetical protein EI94DRAFT_695145 [Lactarius quietus]|nr:hypothetical protein EI94DRAFT_695145 [Lactarius quietus]
MNTNCPLHGYLPYAPGENDSANSFCQSSASHQPVQQWANTEDLFYTQLQPNLPAPSSLIESTITPSTSNRWRCPICPSSFSRWQERDRYKLTHVPYFMHCPLPHCAWRGNRAGSFRKHWHQEDHRIFHDHYGSFPDRSQIETFNPWVILDQVVNGAISLREGEDQAIFLVQGKACELRKPSMWMDPWGRNKRHLMWQDHWQWQA